MLLHSKTEDILKSCAVKEFVQYAYQLRVGNKWKDVLLFADDYVNISLSRFL